ncbi:MAG TPA: sporangiospore maturation cell wall hydrolase GsmA [Pilimelia sp.]|nr:sporangiospore maturation cell wall hydrolase GsmA [Pilimelia sp.]
MAAVLGLATVPAGAVAYAPEAHAAGAVATVQTGGVALNVRTGPGTGYPRVAGLPSGRRITVTCQVPGQLIWGRVRRTATWDRLADGRYVSDAYVAWRPSRPAVPTCRGAAAPPPRAAAAAVATASTGGGPLNVRAGASTAHARTATVPDGRRLTVVCQLTGEHISGHVRRTATWDRLADGRYVSDAYVAWRPARPALPACRNGPDPIAATPAEFIARVAGPARASMREHRVPASVTIAQAILESGWGRSSLASADHNYFGIKCFGTPGPIAVGCRAYPTTECERSRCFRTTATFRVYRSLGDSVRDHGRFLVVNPRYRPAFAHTRDPQRFTEAIHRAGYATAPGYARSVNGLIRQYGLTRYDR